MLRYINPQSRDVCGNVRELLTSSERNHLLCDAIICESALEIFERDINLFVRELIALEASRQYMLTVLRARRIQT